MSIFKSTSDDIDAAKQGIFINEPLTSYFSLLFKKARDLKSSKIIQFAWVKDGKILIRKTETSKVIRVITEENLNVN